MHIWIPGPVVMYCKLLLQVYLASHLLSSFIGEKLKISLQRIKPMRRPIKKVKLPSSFRDPSGFLFEKEGRLLRQLNKIYKKDYELLLSCGLYSELVDSNLLIKHRELNGNYAIDGSVSYKIIEPEKINFISY